MTENTFIAVESSLSDINHFFIRAIGLAAIAISVLVLLGWYFDIPILKSVIPGANSMKVNTAVGFLFAGISLLFLLKFTEGITNKKASSVLGHLFAGVPLLIGVLTIGEYVFDINSGIDELLMPGESDPRYRFPGRMSWMSAMCFVLLSSGLLTEYSQNPYKKLLIEITAFAVLGIASFVLLGYFGHNDALYNEPQFSIMAVHTAALFFLMSIALLLACPPLKSEASRYATATSIVAVALVIRLLISWWIGPDLPPFITFYPAILCVGLLTGFLPGMFATLLSAIVIDIWIYQPIGSIHIENPIERVSLAIFIFFGIFLSWVLELYHRNRIKAAKYDREQALRESEERYRSLFDGSLDAIFSLGADGHFINANHSALRLAGKTLEELKTTHFLDLCASDQREKAAEAFRAAFCRQCLTLETAIIDAHGGRREIFISGAPTIINEQVVGVSCIARDTTERKQMESVLRESEETFRAMFENSSVGMVITDPVTGRFNRVNKAYCELTGYTEVELLQRTFMEITYLGDQKDDVELKDQFVQGKITVFEREKRYVRPDGSLIWAHITLNLIRNEVGSPIWMFGVMQNISERKQAEAALQDSEKRFRQVTESLPQLIWTCQTDGACDYLSPQWCQYTGISEVPQLGVGWLEQLHPEDRERAIAEWIATTQQGKPFNIEYRIRRHDGIFRWFYTLAVPLRDESGAIFKWFGTNTDIEEKKSNEKELHYYHDHLERLVAERTRELEITSQEALRLSQVKSVFLANMSHEIRSPMNAMLGFLYLLEQKPLETEAKDLVRMVRNGGRNLLAIINDILDFSKIEAGQMQLQHEPFRLSNVIDQVAALMSAHSAEKNLELIIDVFPSLADYLIGDAVKLQQVLVNLASNAIKFTDQGEVRLLIKLIEPVAEHSLKIRFSVRDTGIGIDPAKQQDIFSPFAQADGSISRRFGGTGLGLAISRQMVELMGGSLQVDSELGKGSTFWFELVLEQDVSKNPEFSELKHLNVLIVDDSEEVSAALANVVKFLGWQADTALSGQDACVRALSRLATGKSYDVILADWQMPGMDGITLAREIKKMYQTETVTAAVKPPLVIMVSAFSRGELLTQPDIGNADLVLTKPVTPSTCYDAVLALLSKRIKKPDSADSMLRDAKSAQLTGINVLVVDDSEINCEIAASILSLHGAQVTTFANGHSVIEWLITHPDDTDIILMDVQMPGIDGYETTRLIRQTPDLAHIPIAALTAGAFSDDQEHAKAAGMDDFIPKPFDVDKLISVIQGLNRLNPKRLSVSSTINITKDSVALISKSDDVSNRALIDENEGLRLMGDRTFYYAYLNKFITANMNAGNDILALIQTGDATAASMLAHKVKGTAGNLALKQIMYYAAEVETSLTSNGDHNELCVMLQQAFEDTSIEIRRLTENQKTDV